uniref:hypothetical protein n=1 Tax=Candidatus Cryptobacteroides bacterium TaxID=3085639 RepID=UPI004028AD30
MKKIFLIILTFVSAMFLNSCSKSDVMLSGDWWNLIPDEVVSGSEDLVIRFNSANSSINFALKSKLDKDDKNYYMIESLARKYTVENTGKGEGIIRVTEKDGTMWPELHISSLTLVTLGLSHRDTDGKVIDNMAFLPFLEDTDKKIIKTTESSYELRIRYIIDRFRSIGRLVDTE